MGQCVLWAMFSLITALLRSLANEHGEISWKKRLRVTASRRAPKRQIKYSENGLTHKRVQRMTWINGLVYQRFVSRLKNDDIYGPMIFMGHVLTHNSTAPKLGERTRFYFLEKTLDSVF
jgi:hypothetical protein